MHKQEIMVRKSYIIIRQGDEVFITSLSSLEEKFNTDIAFGTGCTDSMMKDDEYSMDQISKCIDSTLKNWLVLIFAGAVVCTAFWILFPWPLVVVIK
jgi:hypothetical protein